MTDPLVRILEQLPRAEPDAARAERVRARCRSALVRSLPPPASSDPASTTGLLEPCLAGLCLAYAGEVVHQALRWYGWLG